MKTDMYTAMTLSYKQLFPECNRYTKQTCTTETMYLIFILSCKNWSLNHPIFYHVCLFSCLYICNPSRNTSNIFIHNIHLSLLYSQVSEKRPEHSAICSTLIHVLIFLNKNYHSWFLRSLYIWFTQEGPGLCLLSQHNY